MFRIQQMVYVQPLFVYFCIFHFFSHSLAARTPHLPLTILLSACMCASVHIFEYENYDPSYRLTFSLRNNAIESRTCCNRFSSLRFCSLSCAFRMNNTQWWLNGRDYLFTIVFLSIRGSCRTCSGCTRTLRSVSLLCLRFIKTMLARAMR